MNIREALISAGIECQHAACISITEYVCRNTTAKTVDAVLKNIGVYGQFRAFDQEDREGIVYINRMYTNGKSWD